MRRGEPRQIRQTSGLRRLSRRKRRKGLILKLLEALRAKMKANVALKAGLDGLRTYKASAALTHQKLLQCADKMKADLAEAEITALLRQRMKVNPKDDTPFTIRKQDDWIQMSSQQAGVITMFLAIAASISLVVGGIGISNIMLVSVTERTREIGIRKAIGAKRRTILTQFLIEAAMICLLGGLIGLALAYPVTLVMDRFMPATLSAALVGMALLVSVATGVIAGFLPAWRAARMNPVDALRVE